jgi:Protein of unknown function (DUF2939)
MDKKTVIISGVVGTAVAAVAGVGAYLLPYLALDNIKTATANRNANALSREIDFPSLRTSVKENVRVQVMKQISKSGTNSLPAASLELVNRTLNPMVDKIITPEGLAELMQDKLPGGAKIDLGNLEKSIADSEVKMGYESIDRFVVHITDKADRAKDVSLILKRDGLSWKLSEIDISKV